MPRIFSSVSSSGSTPVLTRLSAMMLVIFGLTVTTMVTVTWTATLAASIAQADSGSPTAQIDRIEGQTIYFKGDNPPKPLKTELYDLTFIGMLKPASDGPSSDATPYFLFSANPCPDCATEKALYLIRPLSKTQITSFVYPGKVLDPKTHNVVLDSRAFVGQCVAGKDRGSDGADQYVVFQKERVDHKRGHRIETSVFVAQASADYLREKLIERNFPKLTRTLSLVKAKRCSEIPGRSRVMPFKPRGVDWHNLKQEDEEDDDDSDSAAPSTPSADAPSSN